MYQNQKLIATNPGDCVDLVHDLCHARTDIEQQLVANGMSETLVNRLKLIQPEMNDRKTLNPVPVCKSESLLKTIPK